MSMEDVAASQLGELTLTESTREERLRRHCVLTTQALLHRSEALNDVCFKCSDNEYAFAHKFILGTQCQCALAHLTGLLCSVRCCSVRSRRSISQIGFHVEGSCDVRLPRRSATCATYLHASLHPLHLAPPELGTSPAHTAGLGLCTAAGSASQVPNAATHRCAATHPNPLPARVGTSAACCTRRASWTCPQTR